MKNELFILFIVIVLASCSSGKPVNKYSTPFLVVWNEDTLNSYQLVLLSNKEFHYSIIKIHEGKRNLSVFSGDYQLLADSILLTIKNGSKPKELSNYLTREVSDSYLIQHFEDSSKRIFMRRQKTDHRF